MDAVEVLVIWVDGSCSVEVVYRNQLNDYVGNYKIIPHFECMFVCGAKNTDTLNEAAMEVATEMGIDVGDLYGNVLVAGKRTVYGGISSVNSLVAEDIINQLETRIGV
jgi:hypothetical protein